MALETLYYSRIQTLNPAPQSQNPKASSVLLASYLNRLDHATAKTDIMKGFEQTCETDAKTLNPKP